MMAAKHSKPRVKHEPNIRMCKEFWLRRRPILLFIVDNVEMVATTKKIVLILNRKMTKRRQKILLKTLQRTHCNWVNHDVDHSFELHLKLRALFSLSNSLRKKRLQDQMVELHKQVNELVTYWSQIAWNRIFMGAWANKFASTIFIYDAFIHEASGELVGAVATRSQTTGNVGVPPVKVMHGPPWLHHVGPTNSIGQVQLLMSFGMTSHVIFRIGYVHDNWNCVWLHCNHILSTFRSNLVEEIFRLGWRTRIGIKKIQLLHICRFDTQKIRFHLGGPLICFLNNVERLWMA